MKIIEICESVLKNHPEYDALFYNKSSTICYKGDTHGAMSDYNNAIKENADDATVCMIRGVVKMGLKDYTGALTDFNEAIKLNHDFYMGYANRGMVKYFPGDYTGG